MRSNQSDTPLKTETHFLIYKCNKDTPSKLRGFFVTFIGLLVSHVGSIYQQNESISDNKTILINRE